MNEIKLPDQRPSSQATIIEQSRAVAEVAAAVRVAQDNPRDTSRAVEDARQVCSRLAVAERAFYRVPNRGEGLSIHIAKELARIWGNIQYGVKETARDDEAGQSEVLAFAWDVQTNTRNERSFIVPHAKSTKTGRKNLTDLNDIYLNNQNAGARAVRECIFATLPGWLTAEAEAILAQTLRNGDGKSIEERRAGAVERFSELNITEKQLEAYAEKPKGQWGPGEIANLTRVFMSVTQDGIPVKDFFPDKPVELTA